MKVLSKVVTLGAVLLAVFSFYAGCGPRAGAFDTIQKRITALQEKGVPDSILTNAKMVLFNARSAAKYQGAGTAKALADSAEKLVQSVEAWESSSIAADKPFIDSVLSALAKTKASLTGYQLHLADSMLQSLDEMIKKGKMLESREKCKEIATILPNLLIDEQKAQKLKQILVGTWQSQRAPEGSKFKALEKRVVTFSPGGEVQTVEEFNGQTSEYQKEDWKYVSSGTWEISGDTALIFIKREKRERLVVMTLEDKGGKKQWVKTEKPGYDSTVTNGSRDKYLTADDLTTNFTKSKK